MKRRIGSTIIGTLLIGAFLAVCLLAQSGPDAYRVAFKTWQDADPKVEADAATAGVSFAPRLNKVSGASAAYWAARNGFLDGRARGAEDSLNSIESMSAPVEAAFDSQDKAEATYLAATTAIADRSVATFKSDPDPGMQPIRAALQKERAALTELSAAIAARQTTAAAASRTASNSEQALIKMTDAYLVLAAGLRQDRTQAVREAAAWADYYQNLSVATGGGAGATQLGAGAPRPESNPVAASRPPGGTSITPVPLARYVGDWTYPSTNPFLGAQPQSVALTVQENNGVASGSLVALFKIAGNGDVRFTFSGEFKYTRVQTFPLQTADGVKGTIELIPGPAFNLLEVNFTMDPAPGRVRQANFVLLKK